MTGRSWGVLLDLDQTLVLTQALEPLRRQRAWSKVYRSFHLTGLPPGTTWFIAKTEELARIGVVTTSPRAYAERLLSYHRLQIPVLIAYHDVTNTKPHPEPILKGAEKLGVAVSRCIHVGDQVGDIEVAIRAGAIPILVSWQGPLDSHPIRNKGAAYCSSWEEVYKIIAAVTQEPEASV